MLLVVPSILKQMLIFKLKLIKLNKTKIQCLSRICCISSVQQLHVTKGYHSGQSSSWPCSSSLRPLLPLALFNCNLSTWKSVLFAPSPPLFIWLICCLSLLCVPQTPCSITVRCHTVIMDWPQSSFGFFLNILRKSPNELCDQPNIIV